MDFKDKTYSFKPVNTKFIQEITSFFEDFLQAERELFFRKIEGFHYWHFIRFHFFEKVLISKGWIKKLSRRENATRLEVLKICTGLLINSFRYNLRLDCKKSELLVLNSPKRVRLAGKMIDPYTYALLKNSPHSCTIWEESTYWRHQKGEPNPDLYYFDNLHVEAFTRRLFNPSKSRIIRKEAVYLKDFAERFNVLLSENGINALIQKAFYLYRSSSHIIQERLLKKKVRLVILVTHYDMAKMLVTSIARSLGIYVVELQHGTMGKYHIAYNFDHQMKLDTLPDEIFTLGKYWNDTTRISRNDVKLTPVGMPYFEQKIRQLKRPSKHKKIKILILSQEAIGNRFCAIAVDLFKMLDPHKYEIMYKLHPKEYDNWRITYSNEFKASRIQVYDRVDLFQLLNESDIHIGVYSTAVMESLVFGKTLILFESYGVHYFTDLIESGRAHFARNASDIVKIIQSQKDRPSVFKDVSQYWESNSTEKLHQRIEEILG